MYYKSVYTKADIYVHVLSVHACCLHTELVILYHTSLPLDLLSVEYLDCNLVSGQLMLSQLHLTKTSMTQRLSKNIPTCSNISQRGKYIKLLCYI